MLKLKILELTVKFEGKKKKKVKKAVLSGNKSAERLRVTPPSVPALWDAKLDITASIAALIAQNKMSCACMRLHAFSPRMKS